MLRKNRLIFLGAPGAGKGTFAKMLKDEFSTVHISTGDLLRDEIERDTELGHKAAEMMEQGQLVPDEVVTGMVKTRLGCKDCRQGYVLDGFPRNVNQAILLDHALSEIGCDLDAAVYFEAPDDLLLKRLTARISCRSCGAIYSELFSPPRRKNICDKCGGELFKRPDDSLETAKQRLQVFYENTSPLIKFYADKGKLATITETEKFAAYAALKQELA